ncbi:MAG: DNA mismatch repair protein MutS, partial [Spirochaetales bacterium]|nr:DNA mismatch repair protein MutS [Spirochaetales bacterium]
MAETTPMMQQYNRIKEQHRDAVLFFRLGDFYEMFKQDAVEVSRLLQLTLTHRNGIPMCGIPYHAAEGYINRLLQAGKKIAVCEQITLPSGGKNLADRQVVEIITPGTAIREGFADSRQNNFLVSVGRRGNSVSICWADVGGSDLTVSSVPLEDAPTAIRSHLYRLQTRELLMQESLLEETGPMKQILEDRDDILVNRYPDWSFDQTESLHLLKKQFCVENLKGFGLSDEDPALFAAGILIDYLRETTRSKLPHLRNLRRFQEEGYLSLDESTLRNLEILHNMHDGSEQYTLLKTIDFTATAMGKRRIRNWLVRPLTDKEAIEERLNNVSRLHSDQLLLSQIQDQLREIRDLERLGARMEMDRTNPKELAALRSSLHTSAGLESLLKGWRKQSYFWTDDQVESNQLHTLLELLDRALEDDPPVMISEGKCIRSGYHEELDALREMKNDSSRILDDYLEEQKQRSGIHSLKLKYNKIIGYFLEVTKSNADRVPDDFLRKQQLVGSERYTTNRLIELETAINNASEKIGELEKQLFTHVCKKVRS